MTEMTAAVTTADVRQPSEQPQQVSAGPGLFRRRGFRSIRQRLLWRMLLLVVLTLGLITVAESFIFSARLNERVDAELANEIREFRAFTKGHRPRTDDPRYGVRDLFVSVLQNQVPDRHQTLLSLVDGAPFRRTGIEPPARLDTDPALVTRFAAADRPAYGDATTAAGPIRYVTVPVTVEGDLSRGVLVVATFTEKERAEIRDAIRRQVLLGISALILAAGVGWVFAGRIIFPLVQLRDTARSINESDLTARIAVHDEDEISQLATTFNAMLDRLEESFATQRQFIDDTGHELRTPITIILGHLELLDDDPVARQRSVDVATDELRRMNRIVEELLMLAQARRPEPLKPGHVVLPELVEEVYVKASALAPRRWLLELADDTRPWVLHGDRQLLTQALIQLAQNAAQHTQEHARIWIGGRAHDGFAELWVRDSGPGVPTAEQDRIFERFARGGRARGSGGAGLGLAIVKAIAEAHHGTVTLDNHPGHGATFTLRIPLHKVTCDQQRTLPPISSSPKTKPISRRSWKKGSAPTAS
ncbi:HAMP domain-containing histidine kinase [Streptomyces sp. PSKA54]|uniref:histidine kinase n=2 Tax=Streptomyces TaxID=1883 RepID=A0A7W2HHU8_9ACTN|nr:HAMP domain-containing histidine kinase [Streptomyces himalayensis subsp. aureolus]